MAQACTNMDGRRAVPSRLKFRGRIMYELGERLCAYAVVRRRSASFNVRVNAVERESGVERGELINKPQECLVGRC